jgi:WD40 repeat protein
VDGAIVVIDLVLGVEKFFLEKHPAAISAMAFFEDKVLITGSIDGRVNIQDLENLNKRKSGSNAKVRFSKCQNCQSRKIPIAKVDTCRDFGIGMAVDIEGNCRFYDLIRFKKMAKLNPA